MDLAGRLRAAAHRSRRVPRRAAARNPRLHALRRDRLRRGRRCGREARRLRPPRPARLRGLRRQRRPDHDRRQGGVPLRRLRLTARTRGRRGPCRGRRARAARARAAHDRDGADDRDRQRPPPQRHVRPCDAAHVRLSRRRSQPRGPPDVRGAARARVRRRDRERADRRRLQLGTAPGPEVEGEGRAGRRLLPHRPERARLAACHPLRARDRRARGRAPSALGRARSHGRAGRERRGHLRRCRRGQIAPRRRIRPRRPCRGRLRRLRRVPGLRHARGLRRLAGGLAQPAARRRAANRGGATTGARAGAGGHRPGLRSPGAAARPIAWNPDSRLGSHRLVRRQAPQDVAGSAPGRLPPRSRRRGAARDRGRGLPLDRPALARPARVARASGGGPARALRARLPTGRRAGRWVGARATAPIHGARPRRAGAERLGALDPVEARSALRRGRSGVSGARRARHRPLRGQPVLRGGAAQLHPRSRRRSEGCCGARRARAAGKPAQPDPEPRRHARRSAAPHAQGRRRGRTVVPGRGAPGHLSGAWIVGGGWRAPRHAALARPDHARPRGRAGLPLQARRHPGGGVREHAVRDPRDAARAHRELHRGDRGRRDRAPARRARPPLLAQREPGEAARVPRQSRRGGGGDGTRTRPRSTISSGPRRSSWRSSGSTCS